VGKKSHADKIGEIPLTATVKTNQEELENFPQEEYLDETELGLREKEALQIVRKNMLWAMGLGAIPIPLVDLVSVAAFQAKALKELSDLYEVPFFHHTVKNLVASLISGYGAVYFGQALAISACKAIPVAGPLACLTSLPIMAGALTYAIGKVFIQHFESGGTFLTFDPKKVRNYFRELFVEGLKEVAKINKQQSKESKTPHAAKKEAPPESKEAPAVKEEVLTESKETPYMKKDADAENKEFAGGGKKETVAESKDIPKKTSGRL